jgi:hypothetical protein
MDRAGLSSVEIGITFPATSSADAGGACWNTVDGTRADHLHHPAAAHLPISCWAGHRRRSPRLRFCLWYRRFIIVPTYFAIQLARSIHPVLFGAGNPNAKGDAPLAPAMLQTFFYCLFTFTVLYVTLLWHRIRLANHAERVEQLKAKLMSA